MRRDGRNKEQERNATQANVIQNCDVLIKLSSQEAPAKGERKNRLSVNSSCVLEGRESRATGEEQNAKLLLHALITQARPAGRTVTSFFYIYYRCIVFYVSSFVSSWLLWDNAHPATTSTSSTSHILVYFSCYIRLTTCQRGKKKFIKEFKAGNIINFLRRERAKQEYVRTVRHVLVMLSSPSLIKLSSQEAPANEEKGKDLVRIHLAFRGGREGRVKNIKNSITGPRRKQLTTASRIQDKEKGGRK